MRGKKLDSTRPAAVCAGLALVCWATLGSTAAFAQQGNKVRLVFSDAPKQAKPLTAVKNRLWDDLNKDPKTTLWIRPNIEQRLYLYVQNPTETEVKDLEVQLLLDDATPVPGGQAALPPVPAGGFRQVLFKPAPPPKEKPAKAAPPAFADLPDRSVQVRLLRQGKEIERRTVPVGVLAPRDYVEATAKFNNQSRQLIVTVKAKDNFAGPAGVATMTLLLPGAKVKSATPRGVFTSDRPAVLKAELELESVVKDRKGLVVVTVDGYERAYVFDAQFDPSATSGDQEFKARDNLYVYVEAARFSQPGPKFPVKLGVDNLSHSPREDGMGKPDTLELDLGEIDGGTFVAQEGRVFAGPRQEHTRLACGEPDGAVQFQSEVRDWDTVFDVTGLQGTRFLRPRLLDPKKLVRNPTQPPLPVTFDGTPAEILDFGIPPAKQVIVRGDPLDVAIRATDPESGIRHLVVFVGKVSKEGKWPAEAVQVEKFPPESDEVEPTFSGIVRLPAPTEKASTLELGVQVTNGAGIKSFGVVTVKLVDAPPGTGLGKGSKITGSVLQGSVPQKDLAVNLRDNKGELKDTVATDAKGQFVFQNVPPGTYRVSATRMVGGVTTRGVAIAQVVEGKDKTGVEIRLLQK
jgi:hypothetical protein